MLPPSLAEWDFGLVCYRSATVADFHDLLCCSERWY